MSDEEFLQEFPEAYNVVNFPYRAFRYNRHLVAYENMNTGRVRVVPSYAVRLEPPVVISPPPRDDRGLILSGIALLTIRAFVLITVAAISATLIAGPFLIVLGIL